MLASLSPRSPLRSLVSRSASALRSYFSTSSHKDFDQARHWIKRPSRGGQNLSLRYVRLEKSLRGKLGLQEEIEELSSQTSELEESPLPRSSAPLINQKRKKDASEIFRGFVIPEKPRPPEPDECCMSGCAICVHDLYEESLQAYNESLSALRASLTDLSVPEEEWPTSIRIIDKRSAPKQKEVALSAFEEFERSLTAKKQLQADIASAHESPDGRSKLKSAKVLPDLKTIYDALTWLIYSNS